ncbi:phosphoglycolate phosphatase [Stygiolobus caldivivus]|uniref:Phosphoglycolate phosphatase n=1 Tax=Stygiolobus caldivivus TaxID=2824673 RepID=A0A8D5ZIA9_9CREN|nr:phosphoglycolate phosphatase [Stygiolobus caldivivus]BCU69270.1 phosphoglycolate phosphatase [Stygiolobus caldivivus]
MSYLFASDYDRTLADEKDNFVIKKEVAEFINNFSSRYPFFVVTGRERKFISKLAPALKPTGWVLENGAIIIYQGKVFTNAPNNWPEVRKEVLEELDRTGIQYSVGEVIVYVNNVINPLNINVKGVKVEWNRNDAMILPDNVDKGSGVMFVKSLLNFSGKVVALGDSQNDLSLFKVADIKVAVGNALPEIKAIADIILDKPNGDGILEFLKGITSGRMSL